LKLWGLIIPMADIPAPYKKIPFNHGFVGQIGPIYYFDDDDSFGRAFRVEDRHVNGMGNCHGGMLMAFADMAFGSAISYQLKRYWVTVRLLTDFMAGAQIGDWVEGTGEITGHDGDFYVVKGRIWTGEKTLMQGTGTFKALGDRPQSSPSSSRN